MKEEKQLSPELKIVNDLLEVCTSHGFFGSGLNFTLFAERIEKRGLVGEGFWTESMLGMVTNQLRQQMLREPVDEAKIDALLGLFSQKTKVDLNRIRRIFWQIPKYTIEKPKGEDEEEE